MEAHCIVSISFGWLRLSSVDRRAETSLPNMALTPVTLTSRRSMQYTENILYGLLSWVLTQLNLPDPDT